MSHSLQEVEKVSVIYITTQFLRYAVVPLREYLADELLAVVRKDHPSAEPEGPLNLRVVIPDWPRPGVPSGCEGNYLIPFRVDQKFLI